jgi:hypothetical protein
MHAVAVRDATRRDGASLFNAAGSPTSTAHLLQM